ncbi:MAG: PepSY-like domain-containing protein [Dokdonia sp.]|jgi:hypothetical protein|nr:hypothetical protein [Cytophagaceae bacterium]
MKLKNIPALLVLFAMFTAIGTLQAQDAPEAVKKTFQKKYPGENDPDWHTDSHGNYESHFKIDGIKYRADFHPNGAWIETETSIDKKDLPKAIQNVIKERYGDRKISEVEKVQSAAKGLFYDVEFKQKGKNMDVEFKEDGTIINLDDLD